VPDLSIIILTYNTCDLTRDCVAAALADAAYSCLEVEIIVVDNASTDGTAAALRAAFPTANVIVNPSNLGFGRGNNVGLAAAAGRYLLLLNSDAFVQLGSLRALVEFMDAHPDAGACGPMLLNSDGTLQPSGRSLPSVWSVFVGMTKFYRLWKRNFYLERGRDYRQAARVGEISGAVLLVRREVYERLGGFDPNFFIYYEDVDWCKRMNVVGYAIYYVPTAQVTHLWQGTSQSVSQLAYQAGQDSLRYYFAKHHGLLTQRLIQIMLLMKEGCGIVIYTLRHDSDQRRFHQRMLANVNSPLPYPTARRVKE
jgi:N-acetylglucosaminyl-diphospho-decaprenol L-rhamnosyltransferase